LRDEITNRYFIFSRELESGGEIRHLEKLEGKDGKTSD